MSHAEDELIRGLAKTLGISEAQATETFQQQKERFLQKYERLKRRFPKIVELEQREAEHIKERAYPASPP